MYVAVFASGAADLLPKIVVVELAFGEDAVYGIGIGERGTSLPTKDIVDTAADIRSAIAGAGIPVAAAVGNHAVNDIEFTNRLFVVTRIAC